MSFHPAFCAIFDAGGSRSIVGFSEGFEEFVADQWDRQLERDLQAGRLVPAMKRAAEHYEAGHCTTL